MTRRFTLGTEEISVMSGKNFPNPLWLKQQYDIIYGVETIKSDVRERICQPSGNAAVEKGWAPRGKQVPKVARSAQ